MIAGRIVGATQFVVGATMAATPVQIAQVAAGRGGVAPPLVVRILGLRMAVQGALTVARPSRAVLDVGAGTDALHLASMIGLAAVTPKYRRTALISATVAAASLAGSLGARA